MPTLMSELTGYSHVSFVHDPGPVACQVLGRPISVMPLLFIKLSNQKRFSLSHTILSSVRVFPHPNLNEFWIQKVFQNRGKCQEFDGVGKLSKMSSIKIVYSTSFPFILLCPTLLLFSLCR